MLTGNPVRSAMQRFASASRDPFTIFIFGGSQGAIGINTLVIEAFRICGSQGPAALIHQTGEKDFERVKAAHEKAGTGARVEKFIHDMPDAYREASLLICRSGSSTLSEIAAVGRAAVLVPFPFASDNHQEKNARVFSDRRRRFSDAAGSSHGRGSRSRDPRDPSPILRASRRWKKRSRHFHRPRAACDIVAELLK